MEVKKVMAMKDGSPCVDCDHRDRDKNSEGCVNCNARLEYAITQGMLPGVKLEVPMPNEQVEEGVEKFCIEPGCFGVLLARGRCSKHYASWRSKNPDKIKKTGRGRLAENGEEQVYTIDMRLQVRKGTDPKKREILERVIKIADAEFRTAQNQVYHFLRGAVEEWERQHGSE